MKTININQGRTIEIDEQEHYTLVDPRYSLRVRLASQEAAELLDKYNRPARLQEFTMFGFHT